MTPKEKAEDLISKFRGFEMTNENIATKQTALIAVEEIIKYHESLFEKGFKDVHIAISSPIKTYNDILNPLLKYWNEVKKELNKL